MSMSITSIVRNLALAAAIAMAHGGMEHVMGTVTQVGDNSVTVKTSAGKTVAVNVDAKTTYSRAGKTIQKTDLKSGERVVIHAEEKNKALTAATVEAGAAVAKSVSSKTPAAQH